MGVPFLEAVQLVQDVFASSEVLMQRFGFAASTRELIAETPNLPPRCQFTIETGTNRKVVICFCYDRHGQADNHYFTVEIYNTEAAASFLLEEWMRLQGVGLDPYPFILSSYTGTLRERLSGFVSFLERQLGSEPIFNVVCGGHWLNVPYDWSTL